MSAVYFIVVSLMIIAFAIPLYLEIIPPNPYYGLTTTMGEGDQTVWYLENRLLGLGLISGGITSTLFSVWLTARANKLKKRQIYTQGIAFLVLGIVIALIFARIIIAFI